MSHSLFELLLNWWKVELRKQSTYLKRKEKKNKNNTTHFTAVKSELAVGTLSKQWNADKKKKVKKRM